MARSRVRRALPKPQHGTFMRVFSQRALPVALVGLALIVGVLAFHDTKQTREGPSHPSRDLDWRFDLRPEGTKAYRWFLTTKVAPGSQEVSGLETTFESTLNVRILPNAGRLMMAVQLSSLHVRLMGEPNQAMESAFSVPFVIEIDAQGQFGKSRFPPEIAKGDRAVLDAAIRSLQIVLSEEKVARWMITESDQNGDFQASYQLAAGKTVIKRKQRYSSYQQAGVFVIRVKASNVRAEVDSSGPWLQRSEGTERLQLEGPGGQVLAQVESRFKLEPLAEAPSGELALWKHDLLESVQLDLDSSAAREASAWDKVARELERQQLVKEGVSLERLFAGLSSHRPEDAVFAHQFASFLRVFPAKAIRLPTRLGALGDSQAALLLNILELAGTPEAQAALVEVAKGTTYLRDNRFRALLAIAGLEDPNAETMTALTHMYESRWNSAESAELSAMALFALGAVAGKATNTIRQEIRQRLTDDLSIATDPKEQRLLLRALENGHLDLPIETLRGYLGSESPAVREVAASLIASGGDVRATGELVRLLASEEVPAVRDAAIGALLRLPPNAHANAAVSRALAQKREPDANVRAQIVSYLAAQMTTFPGNREVLQARLQHETNREVIVTILNSLAVRK